MTTDRILTWHDVLPGDVIRGADGQPWRVLDRFRRSITMEPEAGGEPRTGQPRSDSVVALLSPGPFRTAVDLFTACGLPGTLIHQ